jgi:[ribosomal protein S5]-alanine N-acetyltransferase
MQPTTIPNINIPGLSLRHIELSDASVWYEYLSCPSTVEHTSWNLSGLDDLIPIIKNYVSADPASAIRFALQEDASGLLVGTIGLHSISRVYRSAEIAYDLHPSLCGRGVATTCCKALVDWAFSAQKFVRIQATVMDTNLASIRVLEKSGFQLEGNLRSYRTIRNMPRDFRMYSVIQPA